MKKPIEKLKESQDVGNNSWFCADCEISVISHPHRDENWMDKNIMDLDTMDTMVKIVFIKVKITHLVSKRWFDYLSNGCSTLRLPIE